jgi:hypothetical protein
MRLVGNQEIGTIEDIGMQPPQAYVADGLEQSGTLQFCRVHHLPLGKVEAQREVVQSIHAYDNSRQAH